MRRQNKIESRVKSPMSAWGTHISGDASSLLHQPSPSNKSTCKHQEIWMETRSCWPVNGVTARKSKLGSHFANLKISKFSGECWSADWLTGYYPGFLFLGWQVYYTSQLPGVRWNHNIFQPVESEQKSCVLPGGDSWEQVCLLHLSLRWALCAWGHTVKMAVPKHGRSLVPRMTVWSRAHRPHWTVTKADNKLSWRHNAENLRPICFSTSIASPSRAQLHSPRSWSFQWASFFSHPEVFSSFTRSKIGFLSFVFLAFNKFVRAKHFVKIIIIGKSILKPKPI